MAWPRDSEEEPWGGGEWRLLGLVTDRRLNDCLLVIRDEDEGLGGASPQD